MFIKRIRNYYRKQRLSVLLRLILGSVFLVAGAGKLTHGTEFSGIVVGYGLLPDSLAHIYAMLLPWTEIIVGAILILGILPRLASLISLAIIASFITANIHILVSGATGGMCGCFGDVIPLTHTQSLAANFIMLAMALFLLFRPSIKFERHSVFNVLKKFYPVTAVFLIAALVIISFPAPVLAESNIQVEIPAAEDTGVDVIEVNPVVTSDRTEDTVKPKLMYFYNEQCPGCQLQQPVIDDLEEEYGDGIIIERIDSQDNMDLIREYGITSVPTMIVFNGSPADGRDSCNTFTGYTDADTLLASLNTPTAAAPDLQSQDVPGAPISASGMSVQPPDGNQDEPIPARIVTPDDVNTTDSNLIAPTGQTLFWGNGTSFATFGPNSGIYIDTGSILSVGGCSASGGWDDWIYPYSDIYIVPSGSVSLGSTLTDAGGVYNTVWGASGGIFVSQTLDWTLPGGNVGPGTYAIVYDECQNGVLDPIDALFDPAFEVVIPADVPLIPASFSSVKSAAAQQASYYLLLHGDLDNLFDGLDTADYALKVPECVVSPEKCLLKFAIGEIKKQIAKALDVSFNGKAEILGYTFNVGKHYLGIAADPPDPDYRELTPLSPIDYVDAQSNDPVYLASADLTNALMTEGALAEAFLNSVERYQGADAVSDGEWALIHARAVRNYADALAYQLALTNTTIASLDAALAADTLPFDDALVTLDEYQVRMETSGFTDNETLYLLNLGLSQTEIDELSANITAADYSGFSKAVMSDYLADLADANTDAIAGLATFVTDMDGVITALLADPSVSSLRPLADANGSYTVDEGTSLALDGTGSSDPDGSIAAWNWDLDLDGEFDDASGVSPSVTYYRALNSMVGLEVTDDEGRTGIDYAFVSVANVNTTPSIDTYAPVLSEEELELGNTLGFSVTTSDPDDDAVTVQWTLDGAPVATGSSFSYEPVDMSEVGLRIIQVQVSDASPLGGTVTQTWGVSVLAADADEDGWRANLDCDDGDPDVNPGMTEIIGNGKDDDCDVTTGDNPPTADFSYSPAGPIVGADVHFTDTSTDTDGVVVAWEWDFGDGATSDLQDPVHSYASGGSFTVTLTVTDDNGGVASTSRVIAILNAPSAAFTVDKEMNVASLGDGAGIIDYSSVYGTNANYRPENAIDGSTSSQWVTGNGQTTDQWIKVALTGDTTHMIDRVILRGFTSAASIRNFQIRVSNDGTDDADFATVFSGTLPQEIVSHEFTFVPVAARYVQLFVVDNWGYSIYTTVSHFEVHTRDRQGGIVSMLEGLPPSIVDYSSQYSDSYSPEELLDESITSWRTAAGLATNQWVKVELGGGHSYTIERVILDAPYVDYGIRDFEIRISNTTSDDAAFTTVFTGTALNNTEEQEFAFTPVDARYVQLYVINNHGQDHIRESTFKVLTPDRSNVAQGSGVGAFVVAQSSQYSDTYSGEKAIDFSASNFWQTASGEPTDQWLKISLMPGAPYLIDRVRITGPGNTLSPRDFAIRVSNTTIDDAAFTTVYSGTLPQDSMPHWVVFPAVEARYVQLFIYNNYGSTYVSVYDFQVYSPQLGGTAVPFVDLSTDENDNIVSWDWDFGDSATSTEQYPLHTYTAPGTYTVTLITTDSDGLADTTGMEYTVLEPPTADFTWTPEIPDEGQSTEFSDISSNNDGLILGWLWSFPHFSSQPVSSTYSTHFPDNDTYDVTLTVTDSQLLTSNVTYSVTTLNLPPSVNAGTDRTLFWGQDWMEILPEYARLNASVGDPGAADYDSLVVDWDFGDGETTQVLNATTDNIRVSHSYANPGVYVATTNATDKDGGKSSDSMTVVVTKRDTIQKVYATLTSDDGNEIRAATKLWETYKFKRIVAGRTVTFTLGSQVVTAVTDAEGYATAFLTGSEGDIVTASFAGDGYYEASSATGTVGAAPILPVGDVVFVIDESGSMTDDIEAVKANVANIAAQLDGAVDYQLGLVGYGAGGGTHWMSTFPGTPLLLENGEPHIHSPLSDNVSDFNNALDTLIISGGIEPGFSATVLATSSAMGYFRSECPSCVILITDEPATPNINEWSPETKEDAIAALEARNAVFLGIVNDDNQSILDYWTNSGLASVNGGEAWDILEFREDPEPVLAAIMEKCIFRIIEESSANLSISKVAHPEPVIVGEELTYTIEIVNHGPADAINVVFTDILPGNPGLLSVVLSQGTCEETNGILECELGTIEVGATVTIETITVHPEGTIINTAFVSSDRYDPDESNNIATAVSTVIPPNRPPELDPIGDKTVDEGTLLEFTVTASDPDEDDTLEFLASNLPSGADFDVLTQVFSWTPDFEQSGTYEDVYFEVSDGLLFDSENITITVNDVNRIPVALDDDYATDEGITLVVEAPGILENDDDDDGDPLTAVLAVTTANGTLVLNNDGSFTYTPDTDFYGSDNFTYRASDGTDESDTAMVHIDVGPVNDPPVADANGPYTEDEGNAVSFDGTGSYDPDGTIDDYAWDFGNGDTGSGATPQYTYSDNGTFTVTLTVTDNEGAEDTTTTTAIINDLAPTAAFSWTPDPQDEGSAIDFTDISTSSPDDIVSWAWDFAGLGTSTDQDPSYTFMDDGSYIVSLTVTDEDGSTDTVSHDVTVNDLDPTAGFSWTPDPQGEGAAIDFTDTSTSSPDDIVSWEWDFAGLGTSTDQDPSYTFMDDGSYIVSLTVTDEDGSTDTISHDVTVSDLAPTAALTGDTALDEGQTGSYDASGSTSNPDAIVLYEWDWDYDGATFNPSGDTGSLQTHSWNDDGSYTVAVRVTDDDGSTDISTLAIVVNDLGPTAALTGDTLLDEGQTGNYDARGSTSSPDIIVNYEWDWEYDSVTFNPSGDTSALQTHSWNNAGSYTVAVRVTDDNGSTDIATLSVTISHTNVPPVADANGPYWIDTGDDLSLDGTGSYDPDTAYGDAIVYYEWDMNDDGSYEYTGATPTIPWADLASLPQPGVAIPVRLRVTDTFGASNSNATTLTIYDNRPVADFTASPNPAAPAQVITFDADTSYHTHPGHSIVLYEWDFDTDGIFDASSASPTITYAYASFGIFTATLRVTDDNTPAKTDSISLTIQINQGNRSPVADADGPYWIDTGDDLSLDGTGSYDADAAYGDSIVSYEWDMNADGSYEYSGASPTIPWTDLASLPQPGVPIPVRLSVTDSFGATDSSATTLTIYDNRPVADFTASPNPAAPAQVITFDASASYHTHPSHSIVLYEWDFDTDGTFDASSATPTTTYAYSFFGAFTATLRVTDDNTPAKTDSTSRTIQVNQGNRPPVADANGPYVVNEGNTMTLDASGSYDPDAAYGDSIVSYEWDLDDDSQYDDAVGVMITMTFNDDGSYTVGLKVTDSFGASGTDTATVTVNDRSPTAEFTWAPEPQNEGSAVVFTDMSTSSPDTIVSRTWDFAGLGTSPALNPSFSFMDNGTYTVTLTVTDEDGSTDTVSHDITVNDLAPTAEFTWSPEPQNEGSAVTFNDISISSPDIIIARSWDFAGLGTSPAVNPSFTFMDNSIYTITLTVTDDDGSTDTISHDVTIIDLTPTAALTGDIALDEGQMGNYDASGSSSGPDTIVNYEWDWEYDGATFNPSDDTGVLQSHSWPAEGIYNVAVRVTDDDGSISIATLTVTVSTVNSPPEAYDVPVVTDQDTPVNVTLSAYDPDGDDLSYGIISPPINGTLSGIAPDLIYTPNPGYAGPDSFTYLVNDGQLDSNVATVTITVNPVVQPALLFTVEYAWGDPAPGYEWDPFPLVFIGWTHVRIENRGNTDVFNVTASITGYPISQTVPDPDVTVGDIAAGASAWSIDTFTTRTDMTIYVDPCDGWVWRIEYDDEYGNHHVIENVPEFPPGEGPCG